LVFDDDADSSADQPGSSQDSSESDSDVSSIGYGVSYERATGSRAVPVVIAGDAGKKQGGPLKGMPTPEELEKLLLETAMFLDPDAESDSKMGKPGKHRKKVRNMPLTTAMVTRLLTKRDPEYHTQGAKDALKKELEKLLKYKVWDMDICFEWDEVKRKHPDASIARIFPIISLKHAETDNPTYKGRIVLQGNEIKDSNGNTALFIDISSCPSNLNTIRQCANYSTLDPEATTEVADVEMAYIQHELTEADGPDTYIRIPREWLPERYKNMRDPCFKLLRPLYGHPRAGAIWEAHLQSVLQGLGWKPLDAHPNTWIIRSPSKTKAGKSPWVVLTAYVDDLVMAGRGLGPLWAEIRKKLTTTQPETLSKVLGCEFRFEKKGDTTYIHQSMKDFLKSAIEKYRENPNAGNLKHEACPARDIEDDGSPGVMASDAASLLMKPFYAARCCRPDLVVPINALSKHVTRWHSCHDKLLQQLYGYILATWDHELVGWGCHKDREDVELGICPDADHGGCLYTAKSMSGSWSELCTKSESTVLSEAWAAKSQTFTSFSTTESELQSAGKVLREYVAPARIFWGKLLEREIKATVHEDNQATLRVIEVGYSYALRYLTKSNRVSVSSVHEYCRDPGIQPQYIETKKQKGDLFTKILSPLKLIVARDLIRLRKPAKSG